MPPLSSLPEFSCKAGNTKEMVIPEVPHPLSFLFYVLLQISLNIKSYLIDAWINRITVIFKEGLHHLSTFYYFYIWQNYIFKHFSRYRIFRMFQWVKI